MTGVDAHYVYPSMENLFRESPAITCRLKDRPFGSTSIYAQWNVFRLAAENGVKVMLDGQGADEALMGYHGFFGTRFSDLFCRCQFLRLWREIMDTKNIHGYSAVESLTNLTRALLSQSLGTPLIKLVGRNYRAPAWLNLAVPGTETNSHVQNLGSYSNSLHSLSYEQLTVTSIPLLLHWEDRDSMAHSIESRVPFLDYRLVEFMLGLPDEFKLSDGITKRVLREGMSGVLPDRIRDRMDKLGFVTPEASVGQRTGP